jgi:hypothetical protein
MKKILLSLVLTLSILSVKGQEQKQETFKQDEVKLNGLFLILGAFEATYERILNEESAIGISALLSFDDDISDDIKYYISPYYRMYFGHKNIASGFFAEGFAMLNSTNREINLFGTRDDDFRTDLAFGFGFGGKWVTKKGFIFELSTGIGRNFFNNDNSDYEVIGKGGITLGYRF